jgi:UDP-N-acetylglucosamine 2-epimerase
MQQSYMFMTDSGDIKEEATFFGKPVLVMCEFNERPEVLEALTVLIMVMAKD